jgi:hypothetical protein
MTTNPHRSLSHDYNILRRYLGEVRFNAITKACGRTSASLSVHAGEDVATFPALLAEAQRGAPELCELASLEKATIDAFNAPDAAVLTRSNFERFGEQHRDALRFTFHPSLNLLTLRFNVTSIWSALKCEEEPPRPFVLLSPQRVLVWRQNDQPRMRLLGEDEFVAISTFAKDESLGAVRAVLTARDSLEDPPARLSAYVCAWLDSDVLSDASLGGAE